jgi:hypothetical protein
MAPHPVAPNDHDQQANAPARHRLFDENTGFQPTGIDIPAIDKTFQAGELTLEEATSGGIGRHLGLTSSTLLMSAFLRFIWKE